MQAALYVMIVLDACVVIAEILLDLHAMRSKLFIILQLIIEADA